MKSTRTTSRVRGLLFFLALLLAVPGFCSVNSEQLLQNGVPFSGVSDADSGEKQFQITVPPGATSLTFAAKGAKGGRGDADYFVKFGSAAATDSYDKADTAIGNTSTFTFTNPQAGDWFLLILAASAYNGVTLTASFTMGPGVVAPPVYWPAGGHFSGHASVRLSSPTKGAAIHFTTDGGSPDATTPTYSKPFTVTTTTTVKTRGFSSGLTPSASASATFTVTPESTVTDLQDNVAVTGLSGSGLSNWFFHFVVPSGQTQLAVQNSGGGAATDLYLKRGSLPTAQISDAHGHVAPGHDTFIVSNPQAGDWFILMQAKRDYANASFKAHAYVDGPDLIPWKPAVDPHISVETFNPADCEVQEGYVLAGTRRLLRFTTEARNIGTRDGVLGIPTANNPNFVYAACHGHYHYVGYANYRLLDQGNNEAALGAKIGFCLEDVYQWDPTASSSAKFTCESQGIQVGWADVYDSSLEGQWIDITGVPAGDYTLEITVNSLHKMPESDYSNNTIQVPVTIPAP